MEASAVPRAAPTGVAAFASPSLLRLLSDDRLVALVRDGNANAFEALYDRHHRAILSFCRHMLGEADEAEDAVQHTFIAAYNDLVTSRKTINLRAWLFAIARNRCVTMLRARRDRTALELGEPATDGLAAEVQRRQDLRDLVLDINHLPTDQRAALVLAEIGALSHDEIGSVIGVPRGKVKALVFQARESLLASRDARETDCREIREQLATVRGGALRRTTLRRHLRQCEGCREFRGQVERQRQRIAIILPVLPTIALREAVLGAAAGGGVAAAGGGLLSTGSLLKGIAGKSLIATLVAALGTGTMLVVHVSGLHAPSRSAESARGGVALGNLSRGASPLASRSATADFATDASPETAPGAAVVVLPGTATSRAGIPARLIGSHLGAGKASGTTVVAPGSGATATAPTATSTLASGTPVAVAPVLPAPVAIPSPPKGSGHGSGDAPPGSSGGTGTGSPLGGMPGAGDQGSAGGQGTGGSPVGLSGKGGSGSSTDSSNAAPSGPGAGNGSGDVSGGAGGGGGGSDPGSSHPGDGGSASGGPGASDDLGPGGPTGASGGPTASGVTGSGATASGLTASGAIASGLSAVGRSDARHASGRAGNRSALERGSRVARHRARHRARLDGRMLRFR